MRDIAILILIFVFFLLAIKSREKGMYVYWWFAIFRPHDWVYMDLGALKLPLMATALFLAPAVLQKILPKFNNSLAKLILTFFLLQALSTTLNGCSEVPIFVTMTLFGMFLLFIISFISAEIISTRKILFFLIIVIVVSIGFHSGKAGLISLTGANYAGKTLLGGFMTGSNALALSTGLAIFYMLFCYKMMTKEHLVSMHMDGLMLTMLPKLRSLVLVVIAGSFLYIAASESRGSFLATTLGLGLYFALQKNKAKVILLLTLTMAIAIPFVSVPVEYQERILSAFVEKEDLDKSAASRPHFWAVAAEMVKDHPLGVGTGCYPAFYNNYDSSNGEFGYYRSVHSSHFQILADIGYFGVLVWLVIFLTSIVKLRRVRKLALANNDEYSFQLANSILCLLLTFFIGGAFYEVAYNDILWLTFVIVITLERFALAPSKAKSTYLSNSLPEIQS